VHTLNRQAAVKPKIRPAHGAARSVLELSRFAGSVVGLLIRGPGDRRTINLIGPSALQIELAEQFADTDEHPLSNFTSTSVSGAPPIAGRQASGRSLLKMKLPLRTFTLGLISFDFSGCAGHRPDPAGEARTKNAAIDARVASLREPIQVEALERIWGIAEGQPGPVVTYRSVDHAGQFFWVYYSRPEGEPDSQIWLVERIIRADRIEEGGVVVWPPRLIEESPVGASPLQKPHSADCQRGQIVARKNRFFPSEAV
jgi:hypothetical protein